MATEYWLRNPQKAIRQALVEGYENFVFDQALANWQGKSPHAFMREHFLGTGLNPKYILVGDQGARLYNLFTPPANPLAVWPTWSPDQDLDLLEHYLALPQGEDVFLCTDPDIDSSIRPVMFQEHRVFITGGLRVEPRGPRGPMDALTAEIDAMNKRYPEAKIHLSGAASFITLFNWSWHSVDWSPDELRVYGILQLPNGMAIPSSKRDDWHLYKDWIELMGFTVDRLNQSRQEQVHFHLRVLRWAAENYNRELRVKRKYSPGPAAVGTPQAGWPAHNTGNRIMMRNSVTTAARALPLFGKTDGDKAVCDHCVFKTTCTLARAGQVCGIEDTEMGELSKHFNTRNPDSIIDGLTKLLSMQSDRLEASMEGEDVRSEDGPNPEVTRQINSVFSNGTALAKLLNPDLTGKGTKITNQTLNINGGNIPFSSNDPRQVMSAIVKELQAAGIPRDEITPDMIKAILRQGADAGQQQAIEGAVVNNTSAKE